MQRENTYSKNRNRVGRWIMSRQTRMMRLESGPGSLRTEEGKGQTGW